MTLYESSDNPLTLVRDKPPICCGKPTKLYVGWFCTTCGSGQDYYIPKWLKDAKSVPLTELTENSTFKAPGMDE